MVYSVVWSELALHRLEEIVDRIAQDSPEAAAQLAEQAFDRAATLASFPKLGRLYPGSPEPNLRELLVSAYRIVYEVHEAERQVWIVTVRHQRRQSLYPEDI